MQERSRILFVDDHADTRYMVETWLGLSNYEVVTANDVAGCLKVARSEAFDLYLLDGRFSDGTGTQLCEKLREFDQTTPIVFNSGESSARQELNLTCGAQGVYREAGVGRSAADNRARDSRSAGDFSNLIKLDP